MLRPEIEQEILPFCLRAQHRRDSVLADAVGPADRQDDARADCVAARRRLAPQQPVLSGAAAVAGRSSLVERCSAIGEQHGRTPGEVAIAWTLRHPAITATIVGARNPQQIDELIGAATFRLSPQEIEELDGGAGYG